jgi:hypothetical protein
MSKKTSFEQVSLDVVKRIIEEQAEQQEPIRSRQGIKNKLDLEPILLERDRTNGKGGKV